MSKTKTKYVTFRDLQRISKQSPQEAIAPAQPDKKTIPLKDAKRSGKKSAADLNHRSFADLSLSASQTLSARQPIESVPEVVTVVSLILRAQLTNFKLQHIVVFTKPVLSERERRHSFLLTSAVLYGFGTPEKLISLAFWELLIPKYGN